MSVTSSQMTISRVGFCANSRGIQRQFPTLLRHLRGPVSGDPGNVGFRGALLGTARDLQQTRARSEIFDKAHPRHVVPDGTGLGDPVAQLLIQANDTCVSCLGACANEGHALVAGFVLDCQLQP